MAKTPRSKGRRRQNAAPSSVSATARKPAAPDAHREVALAASREVEERVQSRAPPSRGPRSALRDRPVIDFSALAGIEIEVPVPDALSEADVDARLLELLRARAGVRPLQDGAPLALGDEVLLDAMGYANGSPMSAHVDAWMRLAANPMLPGLFEEVARGRLGEPQVVRLVLPADYPQRERAGQPAAFVIKTKAANRPNPVSLDDEAALLALGRGADAAAVRDAVRAELLEEEATRLVEEAKRRFLDEVERRVPLDVDEGEVESELVRRWRLAEGDALARQGATSEEQRSARVAYGANAERRREARHALWSERLFAAVADEVGIQATLDDVVKIVVQAASASALPVSRLHTAVRSDAALAGQMVDRLRQSQSLSWLLERATVRFVP